MRFHAAARVAMATLWLVTPGCTSLREIPRGRLGERPEHRQVRLVTVEGLQYELDFARVRNDSLIGFRRRDVEGAVEEYDTVAFPLERVARLSARRIDWYRTGLVGGIALAAVIAAGLSARGDDGAGSGDGGCRNCEPQR